MKLCLPRRHRAQANRHNLKKPCDNTARKTGPGCPDKGIGDSTESWGLILFGGRLANTDGPSAHLTWAELACKDAARTPYPFEWRATRALELAAAFESVRRHFGAPLRVTSGYRTPEHNKRVAGAKASQHMAGRALDISPLRGGRQALDDLVAAARRAAAEGLVRGLAVYSGFVHIDTRQGQFRSWRGGSRKPEAP